MKCKLIRDDMEVSTGMTPEFVQANSEVRMVTRNNRHVPRVFWKTGTVLDHPQAFRLVQQGCAVPDDPECAKRCNMSTEQLAASQHAYTRLVAGIHPEDFALYDAGIIAGYTDEGGYKPGPNAKDHPEVFTTDDEDDDDDEPPGTVEAATARGGSRRGKGARKVADDA